MLNVQSAYTPAVTATAGLIDYWRLAETSGTSLARQRRRQNRHHRNGPTLRLGRRLASDADSNTAARFDGTNEAATASLNLSGTNKLTIEFWLKWTTYSNNDDLAFEFTSNSSNNNGGFFIDPNSPEQGGRFGVGIGRLTAATPPTSSARRRTSGTTTPSSSTAAPPRRSR